MGTLYLLFELFCRSRSRVILCQRVNPKPVPRRRNDESGRYQEVYSDEDILSLLEGTRLSTSEVADQLDCHRTTAHDRLTELEDEGKITSKQVGNTLLWEIQPQS
ncbi:helix-turn-helix domain-containing protein [Halomicrobium sp. LC1Hm]|uniref:helix-turn-helix domain-containing protein n=1 Tax=Halomicrobium sp. LC1Hm TaxID=2610902 RepID=UPI00350E4649